MPTSVAAEMAANTAVLVRLERRFEEDYKERKEASKETERTRRAVTAELLALRNGQDAALQRLDKIEPVTDLVTSLWAKMIGAVSVLGVIGAILWGGIVFFKDVIMGWFQ